MELSILHIFVDHVNYQGVLRFCIRREFHNLCIEMRMHQINLQSKETIDAFKKNLESDPCNPTIINVIPTKEVLKELFYLVDCENVVDYIQMIPETNQPVLQVNLGKNLVCMLEKNQLRRIYNFFNSFVSSFALLDSIFKIYISMTENSSVKQTVPVLQKPESVIQSLKLENPTKQSIVIDQPVDLAAKNENPIEYLLNTYCINNTFRSFVIHHIFNHLRYTSNSVILTSTDTKESDSYNYITTCKIPILFDDFYYNLNYDYINSIFKNTFLSVDENIISFNQKKIIENLVTLFEQEPTSETKLLITVSLFIFYCYQYRYIISQHPDFEFENYFKPETQQAGLNFFIKQQSLAKEFTVEILESEIVEELENNDSINTISLQYKHLIPVSEIDFLDMVVTEYSNSKSKNESNNNKNIPDFQLSSTKILDVGLLMQSNTAIEKIKTQDSSLVNTSNYNNRSNKSNLLNFDQKIITKTYQCFKDYIHNPTTLTDLLSLKELPIPRQVINLFDFFSRNMQKIFTDQEDTNTLSYYKILSNKLPAPKSYSHQTYLYIIYNLIIPYYYDTFKTTKFTDSFL